MESLIALLMDESDRAALCEAAAGSPPVGDIMVCGTFQGGDVRQLRNLNLNRRIVVVDSFLGLAEPGEWDLPGVVQGMFACSLEQYVAGFAEQAVALPEEIHRMFITPDNLLKIRERPLSLLWMDLDHYLPTITCLRRFWGWLVPGAVVLTHDFRNSDCCGVQRACEEFAWEQGGLKPRLEWSPVGSMIGLLRKPGSA